MFDDLTCPDCRDDAGVACRRCGGRGVFVASGCPSHYVDPTSREAIRLASFAERGILPRSGGLDVQRQRDARLIELAWGELNLARYAGGADE
jgi:hypothetical protein